MTFSKLKLTSMKFFMALKEFFRKQDIKQHQKANVRRLHLAKEPLKKTYSINFAFP